MKTRKNTRKIILHYTATPPGRDVDADTIRGWHLDRGFSDIGYHFVVRLDGTIEQGRPLHLIGAHTKGQNHDSVGIAYVGGLDEEGCDTMNIDQDISVRRLIMAVRTIYGYDLTLHGHLEFKNTLCPGFDVNERYGKKQPSVL